MIKIPITFTVRLRIEKGGRGGKTVTIIDGFPKHETYLAGLARMLKSRCGSGGTYRMEEAGIIEIQGDKRELIRKILEAESIPYKG